MPRTQYCDPSCLRESYVMRGLPAEVRHALVKVCVDAQPCTVFEQQQAMRTHRMLQFIPLPDQRRAQDYDRSLLRVTLHAGDATWHGRARLHFDPSECGCNDLHAAVAMRPVPNPRG